jgi:TPR repeat protein
LKEAADFNYPPALYKLGYCYEYGHLGVEIDISTSISLYQIAAKAGNKEAQLALSGWLLSGYSPIIAKNERESFYWAHLSALQGLARAEYTMGYFLESGIGANRNNTEAIKWYQSAARHGDEMALKRLSEIGYSPKSSKKNKLLSFF